MNLPEHLHNELHAVLAGLKAYVESRKRSGMEYEYRAAAVSASSSSRAGQKEEMLRSIRDDMGECRRCKLHHARRSIVFGRGNPDARLMFIGEAPGADEDLQGEPFVGKAGQLLTRIIKAINLERSQVYITNIIKCRPPGNRDPEEDEMQTCIPFLHRQIDTIQPRIICALGRIAAQALLGTDKGITELRGKFHMRDAILVMPTYHPSYLLRNEDKKKEAWKDMQIVQQEYNRSE